MKNKQKESFWVIVIFAFVVRAILALFPSFSIDMGNWIAWSKMIAESGISNFYSLSAWTDYTPGFLYYLWILGTLDKVLHFGSLSYPFLIKLPIIFADIGVGLLVYKIFSSKSVNLARFGFLVYVLNPVIIFANSVWGQTDGLIALLLLLSAYFLTEKKNVVASSLFWVLALLVKPQALLALPILLIYSLLKHKFTKTLLFGIYASVFAFIIPLPFFVHKNPILGLPSLIVKMSNESPFTSVMSFNFWALVKGMWLPDSGTFLGMTYLYWGMILLIGALLIIFIKNIKNINKKWWLYLILGLSYFAFFLFSTRIHERYILAALPFLLISAGITMSKFEFILYFLVSALSLVNIYHPYAYYTPESFLSNLSLLELTTSTHKLLSALFILVFILYFFRDKLEKKVNFKFNFSARKLLNTKPVSKKPFVKFDLSPRSVKYLLAIILSFSFLSRVAWLSSPGGEYFDEVYHAFTARQILHGSPVAWEWWNTPPEGFAYEWTHPPLAKLGMVFGMIIFGENSFGWRIPGALLGVGSVFLVFLIARQLFKDELLALLSAAIFGLEGLALVMSRIGMNDSYLLFFVLLSIFLFLKNQNCFSAISFGLAFASKWSVIWVIPILFVLWLRREKKFTPGIIWFLIFPPLIYLASYLPMFLTGHGLDIFWEMQKQMWWYHTGLRATHPYTSPWWNWPLLVRPIYLYTSSEIGGLVSRIYAMGNPLVFWFGIVSVAACAVWAFMERNKNLALVIFSYFIFFVPWAASPRIMFLYHYLPSLPFLAVAVAYVLRRNLKLMIPVLSVFFITFIYFYPHWAGLNVPIWLDTSYYWFASWR